ncbi:hypothetical protein [Treponema pedis]|uniref:hypothetical protein n=1 Tax=Treponema pedis TaxID=409322 RepID=UPI00197E8421|nr:hypothetical protein [Treponema pedis]QSI05576.1 hypothetical protein DYQ05_11995 [Treponema pedis]
MPYYKTSAQVGGGKISYKILLKDSKGLTSSEFTAGTPLNKAAPVKLKYGDTEISPGNESTPFEIGTSSGETITLIATSDTAGAKIKGTKKLNDGEDTHIEHSSPFDIKLQRKGPDDIYKLILYATADNFADSEVRTYYIKLTNAVTITEGPGAWKELKNAVADAAPGATITIKGKITATNDSGNNGQIKISKKLTIRGIGGNAVLDAGGQSRIFNVMDSSAGNVELTLENLTLQNGYVTGSGGSGGGILVNNKTTLTMTNVTIKDCSAQGSPNDSNGGGIYSSGTVTMTGGSIQGCTAKENGGGVFVNTGGTFTMTGGSIQGCKASKNGGGVYVSIRGNGAETAFNMQGGTISGNTAAKGKGVYLQDTTGGASGIGNFIMGGSSVVGKWESGVLSDGNDVYLSFGNGPASTLVSLRIDSDKPLTSGKAACITPGAYGMSDDYTAIRMSKDGDVGAHVSRFTVTPNGTENWTIDEYGKLKKKLP